MQNNEKQRKENHSKNELKPPCKRATYFLLTTSCQLEVLAIIVVQDLIMIVQCVGM
jgi:hypothetical protein